MHTKKKTTSGNTRVIITSNFCCFFFFLQVPGVDSTFLYYCCAGVVFVAASGTPGIVFNKRFYYEREWEIKREREKSQNNKFLQRFNIRFGIERVNDRCG